MGLGLPWDPPVTLSNPPEAVSLKFDDERRVRQITTGCPLDRRCGTTGGLGGLFWVFEYKIQKGLEACLGCLKASVTPCQRPLLARVLKYECSSIVSECSSTSAQVLSPILSLLGSSPAKEVAPAMTEIDDQAARCRKRC